MPWPATHWATSLVVGVLLVATGGCGEEPSPKTAVPHLESALSRVDESIMRRNWERTRKAVQRLIVQAGAAREAGTLTQEQADRIQAAAARLLSELPEPPPPPPPEHVDPDSPGSPNQDEDEDAREEDSEDAEEQEEEDEEEETDDEEGE